MNNITYSYRFPEIHERKRPFAVECFRDSEKYQASVAVNDYDFLKIGQMVTTEIADIVDLAVSVSTVDRLSICVDDIPNYIEVVLPLRNPALFNDAKNKMALEDILYWYTGDHWQFTFTQRGVARRGAELQGCLAAIDRPTNEVALWSGGLDALAGLFDRLHETPASNFTLVGTGSNNIVHKSQKETILALQKGMGFGDRVKLLRVPIKLRGTVDRPKNFQARARGLVFLLIGAAAALQEEVNALHVYENGIGAINLPFRDSEVGLDHARSVNPLSLIMVSRFITNIAGKPFRFHNPYLFTTKAQMCNRLVMAEAIELIRKSKSCDRMRRQKPMQCGLCSSCLLRRQSLAVFGVETDEDYIATSGRTNSNLELDDMTHYFAMLSQVQTLRSLLSKPDPWRSLSRRFPMLSDIVDRSTSGNDSDQLLMQQRLVSMYKQYVSEWDVAGTVLNRAGDGSNRLAA